VVNERRTALYAVSNHEMISNEVQRVSLRPLWFFYYPPIMVSSNEVCIDGTAILSVHPSHSKVEPNADHG
jgi:hypothetical protein